MYSNTGYEALYQLMGLRLQEAVTAWITSEVIFKAAIILIFGSSFFLFLVKFMSNYMPVVVTPSHAPLGRVILMIFSLFIGISILKVDGVTSSNSYDGRNWAESPYIREHGSDFKSEYKTSLLFKLLQGSAEEIGRSLSVMIDRTFAKVNSESSAPSFFYRSLLGATSDTIKDPNTKELLLQYTNSCLSKLIPKFSSGSSGDPKMMDSLFSNGLDDTLSKIELSGGGGTGPMPSCKDLKQELDRSLDAELKPTITNQLGSVAQSLLYTNFSQFMSATSLKNYYKSNLIINSLQNEQESTLGINKMAELPGTDGAILQNLEKAYSFEGLFSLLGNRKLKGVTVAVDRAEALSDHLSRAPHIAGFIKLLLIGFFPVLVFFLAAGKWKPMSWWWMTYTSVCLWNPLWQLLYHIITDLTVSTSILENFGRLGDQVSLYSATIIQSRLYQAYSVYAALQLFVGPTLSGALLFSIRPLLSDSSQDHMPKSVNTARHVARFIP